MAQKFYVSHDGQQIGPWDLTTIVDKVKSNELTLTDYLYDEQKSDWVLLLEYPSLADKLKNLKPASAPKPGAKPDENKQTTVQAPVTSKTASEAEMVTEWFVLKGENKFGPFVLTDIVKMLQEKVIFEFDFAWHPGMSTWKRIADLDAFKADNIQKLKTTLMPEISEVFFRRRHRRIQYGATILVHDNNSVWKGQGVEISSGGAGVIMENSMIVPGQTLYLHFKPGDGVPPFNAVCEVVSKRFVDNVKEKNAPIRYGLKFKSINNETQKWLQDFTKRGDAAA